MELNIKGTRYHAFRKVDDTSATCVQETEFNRRILQVRWWDGGLKLSGHCEAYRYPGEHFGETVRYQTIPIAVRRALKKAVQESANESE